MTNNVCWPGVTEDSNCNPTGFPSLLRPSKITVEVIDVLSGRTESAAGLG